MSVIKRQIWVTQRLRIQPIDIVQGSEVGIALQLMDYDIPSRAAANAYARGKNTTTTYISPCTISGDTVSFTPEDGFFVPGLNLLQIEINGAIIPFSVNVICEGRISELGDSAPPEQVRPLVERAVAAAAAAEEAASNASQSATAAAGSANAAKSSESNAKASETAAKTAATTAADEANTAVAPLVERAETAATDAETALEQVPEAASAAVRPLAERAETAASAAETAASNAETALNQVPESAETAVRPFAERAETAATKAEQALATMEANYQDVGTLQTRLTSGKIEDADLHLGWYLDADGKLRPKERSINMGDQSLTGLPVPTADTDAANKGYVDTALGTAKTDANAYAAGLRVRNLLDNSDFTNPVNQRGQESYSDSTGSGTYSIDRWAIRNANLDVKTGTISANNDVPYIGQSINDKERYLGKTLTLAVKIKSGSGSFGIANSGKPIWWGTPLSEIVSFNGPGVYCVSAKMPDQYQDTNLNVILRGNDANALFSIEWVALYEGEYTAETLPPYVPKWDGAELAECQRHQVELTQPFSGYGMIGIGLALSASDVYVICPIPVPLRTVPAVEWAGTFRLIFNTGAYTGPLVTEIRLDHCNANGVTLHCKSDTPFEVGQTYGLWKSDDYTAHLLLNSNL